MKTMACGLLVLLIAANAACAGASSDEQINKMQKRNDQARAVLAQRPDADSLAAAGLLSRGDHAQHSLALLSRAVDAAPDRPELLWLQSARCGQVPSCDPQPMEHRLRELDPSNGAGWWAAVARAGAAQDTPALEAALTAISRSQRFDVYWSTLIAHLTRAVAATHKMSLREAEESVIGLLAAEAIPAYLYISKSCSGERLQQPGATEICRGVAKSLQNGDTYITEMIGVNIAKHVWPEDAPEWKAAAENRRVYGYRSKLFVELSDRLTQHREEYLTLCDQNRREADLFAALLVAAGYDPNPP